METNESIMTERESLQVIQRMINAAKQEIGDRSFYYLLWGWLVFVASLGHYLLMMAGNKYAAMMWMLMPLGAIVTMIYSYRSGKKITVKTYFDEFNRHALVAFLVSLFIVIGFMWKLQLNCYPMIMMVYGVWLYMSGGALRFKPLMIGGAVNWVLSIAAFYADFRTQLLLLAAAVLLGYIIPGYMLKSRYQKTLSTN